MVCDLYFEVAWCGVWRCSGAMKIQSLSSRLAECHPASLGVTATVGAVVWWCGAVLARHVMR